MLDIHIYTYLPSVYLSHCCRDIVDTPVTTVLQQSGICARRHFLSNSFNGELGYHSIDQQMDPCYQRYFLYLLHSFLMTPGYMTLTLGPRKNPWRKVAFLLEKTV